MAEGPEIELHPLGSFARLSSTQAYGTVDEDERARLIASEQAQRERKSLHTLRSTDIARMCLCVLGVLAIVLCVSIAVAQFSIACESRVFQETKTFTGELFNGDDLIIQSTGSVHISINESLSEGEAVVTFINFAVAERTLEKNIIFRKMGQNLYAAASEKDESGGHGLFKGQLCSGTDVIVDIAQGLLLNRVYVANTAVGKIILDNPEGVFLTTVSLVVSGSTGVTVAGVDASQIEVAVDDGLTELRDIKLRGSGPIVSVVHPGRDGQVSVNLLESGFQGNYRIEVQAGYVHLPNAQRSTNADSGTGGVYSGYIGFDGKEGNATLTIQAHSGKQIDLQI